MTNILQLKQEQFDLPFEYFRGMHKPGEEEEVVTDHEGRYLMVPTDMYIEDYEGLASVYFYNSLLQLAKAKGFTHLMLIYV